jgi:hypothetical protein
VSRDRIQVFAVVRVDRYSHTSETEVVVQAVLPTIDDARSEAERLNDLNGEKNMTYVVRATRYYPEGRTRPFPVEDA